MKKKNDNLDFIASKFNQDNITAPPSLSENAVMEKLNRRERPSKPLSARSGKRTAVRRAIALAACFVLMITAGVTANTVRLANRPKPLVNAQGTVSGISSFTGYRQLRSTVNEIDRRRERSHTARYYGPLLSFSKSDAVEDGESGLPAAGDNYEIASDTATESAKGNYAQTNRQVDAVDEADIIKTDGKYIYYIHSGMYSKQANGSQIMIFAANGAETSLASVISLPAYAEHPDAVAQEMLLCGDRLVVFVTYYNNEYITDDDVVLYEKSADGETAEVTVEEETSEAAPPETTEATTEATTEGTSEGTTDETTTQAVTEPSTEEPTEPEEPDTAPSTTETPAAPPSDYHGSATSVLIYNIENKSAPFVEARYNQSGAYSTSRCIGDYVYLITEHFSGEYYVPLCGCDDTLENVPIENIAAVDGSDSTDYAVIGAVNIKDGSNTQTQALMGVSNNVYCNGKHLYLAGNTYEYRNRRFNYSYDTHTQLTKYALDKENISLIASATVDGLTNDQFSLDEKDGNLRIATTSTNSNMQDTNNLFVLDEGLREIGKVTGFANDEHIESVRFIGDTAYVVTFRQTDPLFIIDLSDPTAPKITGEVKLDGFSTQLTPVDENTLLGIGWGGEWNDSLKLVVFDIRNRQKPTVSDEVVLQGAESSAQYTHKAIVINREAGYFAIPIETGGDGYYYDNSGSVVYGAIPYEAGALKFEMDSGKLRLENYASGCADNRCTYIGDYLYTVGIADNGDDDGGEVVIQGYNVKTQAASHVLEMNRMSEKSFDFVTDDIAAVTVSSSDGKRVTLDKAQTEAFLTLLGSIRLKEAVDGEVYTDDGYFVKGITFTVERTDGLVTEILPDGEECQIDGYLLYEVENPEACTALERFGETVLGQ